MSRLPTRTTASLLLVASWSLAACGAGKAPQEELALDDPSARRAALEVSLVNPHNEYSRLRLAHYATGAVGDWDRLPEWNPRTQAVGVEELGSAPPASLGASARALPLSASPTAERALLALGRRAFSSYPVQLAPYLSVALQSREGATRHGLWLDPTRGVGGLVRVELADGSTELALTCASCHAAERGHAIEDGLPNANLDLGRAMMDAAGAVTASSERGAGPSTWGPGRVDVTTTGGEEPARIPDLRPVRWLTHLHQDATVSTAHPGALEIRIETLLITASAQVLRPPRILVRALARYVESLAGELPAASGAARASARGESVFEQSCASCHVPPSFTGRPVALAEVGTDDALGLSAERGTCRYRVPSLRGVSTRGPLLHDGTVPGLDAFLDPARLSDAWTRRLHGSGAVVGHEYGLDLSDPDRAALLRYLEAL